MLTVKNLSNGGIIPIYKCPAACRHCLYGCSDKMNGNYIDDEQIKNLCALLRQNGGSGVHIGGGEPFLNFPQLKKLIQSLCNHNIYVDYIETNAAWCSDNLSDEHILDMLYTLQKIGGGCLLISVDPFHIEFVELKKPLRLIRLCERANMEYFVWRREYLDKLIHLDHTKKYTRCELEDILGADYIYDTACSYGLAYNGRALNIAREYSKKFTCEKFLSSPPCSCLTSTNHFHADFNGYFIPPTCTGLGVNIADIGDISPTVYPVFTALATRGVGALYEYAQNFGFSPCEDGYVSKCDFCFDMRKFLLKSNPSKDIYPVDYYNSDF